MWQKNKIFVLLLLLLPLHWRCIDKYNSPYTSPKTGYLVVEGYISGNGSTQYTLSRTIPLPGDSSIPMETGARLQIEGNDNSVYPLTELGSGVYGVDTLPLSTANQYRLRINTAEGEQYLSSFVSYKPTPPIDSISWTYNTSGVNTYVNTHDPANNTRYYQWNYTETWQYTSAEQSYEIYEPVQDTVIFRPYSEQDYNCWITRPSTNILVGNSTKLAQDVISEAPINFIPIGTQQISVLYSILIRQYALTADAYNFLSLMQQNTESLGSIFDATPSQLVGNIQCLTNPSEPVIGYVSAGTVQQQRLFIPHYDVAGWVYAFGCGMPDHQVPDIPDSLKLYYISEGYVPITQGVIGGPYTSNLLGCVDCRTQGGTNVQPAFWPN
jgi:Domain of unknown function (DUF4249)